MSTDDMPLFSGADYKPQRDHARLGDQFMRVKNAMSDGNWRTLARIAEITGDPHASVSAQLRHLRKPRFGAHAVNRRYIGEGLYEYQVLLNSGAAVKTE